MKKGTGLENWDLKCRSGHVKLMNCALYVAVRLLCLVFLSVIHVVNMVMIMIIIM